MVTSQKDQIQSLIADIEKALGKERPRTPWVKTSETEAQREALARAQAYLMSLQQSFDAPGGWGPVDPSTGQIASPAPATPSFDGPASSASADNVLQALLTEMKFLKSSALEPLRLEMDSLREERDSLNQEVKALAEQRNQALLENNQLEKRQLELASQPEVRTAVRTEPIDEDQLNQFLQALMTRLQEKLSVQVSNTLGYLETEHSAAMSKLTAATELEILELKPTDQIEEIRQIQSRSDHLLANIDSTLQQMFETMQTNIDSYQLSLNEGIENMHSLGRQGEVIVRSLVDHLTQQLGQSVPPEPAFYPGPPLEQRNALADAAVPEDEVSEADVSESDLSNTGSASDTVSSLNEILPAESSTEESPVTKSLTAETSTSVPAPTESQQTWPTGSNAAAIESLRSSIAGSASESATESASGSEATNAENFIKEDGTIDLDLLKLDIDRSEDDPTLTRDDLMIDAGLADEQVAATLAIDTSDLDSKVTPTADAAFLADLTFDDLVSDADITVPDLDVSGVFEPLSEAPPEEASLETDSQRLSSQGLRSIEPPEKPESVTPESNLGSVQIEEAAAEESVPEESAAEGSIAEESVAEENTTEEDEPEEMPESALVPDLLDVDSPGAEAAIPDEEVDAILSDDLLAVIEDANEDAERIALDSIDTDLAELAPDLEETVVFEGDVPPTTNLDSADQPLESAAIPDRPVEGDTEENDAKENDAKENDAQIDVVILDDELTEALPSAEQTPPAPPVQDIGVTQLPPEQAWQITEQDTTLQIIDEPVVDEPVVDEPVVDEQAADEQAADSLVADEWATDAWATPSGGEITDSQGADSQGADSQGADSQEALEPSMLSASLPPIDFDDDLDFFQADTSPSQQTPSGETAPESLLTTPDKTATEVRSPEETPPQQPTDLLGQSAAPVESATLIESLAGVTALQEAPEALGPDTQFPDNDDGEDDPTGGEPANWFLGIDLGATGISAVMINQLGDQVYPLCWNIAGDHETNRFRLPAVASVISRNSDQNTDPSSSPTDRTSTASLDPIGPAALQQTAPLLRNLKLMVKAGIPENAANVPWMQWSDQTPIPLTSLQNAIVTLLQTLHPDHMSCQAVGLKQSALRRILRELKGVVVGYPTNWPDTYSFNIRESVLAAGLVSSADQVFFVEEAIAALLSALPAPKAAEDLEEQQPGLYNCRWSGGTVIISAGAILTETAVANLPKDLEQVTYGDFSMRGYTYAGDSIDQDIICQLLHQPLKAEDTPVDRAGEDRWSQLGLGNLPLPQPGEADRVTRHRLRQRLNDSALGREALTAARELKVALQEEDEVEVELGNYTWIVTRKDLESKIFMPYIQRINRQVNALLSKQNLATQGVKQVVCTGGSASLSVIARWLRQKFPNATIIQDTYTGEYSNSCSRVAYGLANLCHYPKVLDANRHQYNDYFLLLELLRILPEQPLPAGGILHLLEQRGINTQTCQAHVLALIEGHLPPGLVPTSGDRPLISAQSSDIATYKALSELPLFRKQGGQIYIADPKQGERLRSHLEKLLSTKAQSLSAPMSPAALTSADVQGGV